MMMSTCWSGAAYQPSYQPILSTYPINPSAYPISTPISVQPSVLIGQAALPMVRRLGSPWRAGRVSCAPEDGCVCGFVSSAGVRCGGGYVWFDLGGRCGVSWGLSISPSRRSLGEVVATLMCVGAVSSGLC